MTKNDNSLNRALKAEEIRNNNLKIQRIEDSISKNKNLLKEEKKKLKANVKQLVNSYPSSKKGKKEVKKIISNKAN